MEEKKNTPVELDPEELTNLSGGFENAVPAWSPYARNMPSQGSPGDDSPDGDAYMVTASPDDTTENTTTTVWNP